MSERLEEVKERQYELINLLPHDLYLDVYWLYEQAEQAERVEELEKENQDLREALGFYGDKENHSVNVTDQWEPVIPVLKDEGKKARQALEEANHARD